MKIWKHVFTLMITIAAFSCGGNSADAEAEAQAAAEVQQLDSINQVIENSIEAVESDAEELEAALDSLDALFPEEE